VIPAFAMALSADLVSLSAQELNLVAARSGAQVIKYTSQLGGEWGADKLIDEHAGSGGWVANDGSLPQEIIFRLPAVARFNTVVLRLPAEKPDRRWARDIAIYAAEVFPTMGGWKLVTEVQLAPQPGDQVFSVTSSDARFIRLLINSGQGPEGPRVSLDIFKLFNR
jgi:hypothetical protein